MRAYPRGKRSPWSSRRSRADRTAERRGETTRAGRGQEVTAAARGQTIAVPDRSYGYSRGQLLVAIVATDPEPDQAFRPILREGMNTKANTSGPEGADPLEPQRGMPGSAWSMAKHRSANSRVSAVKRR